MPPLPNRKNSIIPTTSSVVAVFNTKGYVQCLQPRLTRVLKAVEWDENRQADLQKRCRAT
ncbi:hypothetical protein [Bradyrhizobium sp.]|uniref:hypothetical protein n=1 Tax=Bradyrhizobium sp. TaxID=376 RepID=UPI003C78E45D